MTLSIRPIAAEDFPAAGVVLSEAFRSPYDWAPELRRYTRLDPEGWLLADLEGQPAGTAGALCYGVFAHVGLVAVRPAAQRRGVGLALMERVLGRLEERGCPTAVLDATEAGAGLYERLGFVEVERTVRYVLDGGAPPPPSSPLAAPMRPADLEAVAAFDAPLFGADRAAVLAELLAELPGRAFLARDAAGAVAGYLVAQERVIGPWAAAGPAEAEALLGAALRLSFAGQARVTAPGPNADAGALLARYGFRAQMSLPHMRRGPAVADRRAAIYGQASLAIG